MADKPVVGFVGVGLMGWGMAKNAVEKGYAVRVIAHRKREAIDDLVTRGAKEVSSLKEMAAEVDAVVLCVTGSPEVEATIAGLLAGAREGLTILDASTSDPEVTERLARELAGKGMTLLDIPLSRTPVQAWAGELTTFVGGPAELVEKWRPLLATWASAIIPTGGPVGSAHSLKLINNLVALGYAAVWAECYGMARKIGVPAGVFREVVSNSGMNCPNFQNFSKYPVDGDREGHKFSIANVFKDLSYYEKMATRHRAVTLMSDGALQTLKLGMAMGMGERYVPEMTDIVLGLNEPGKA